jgi:hypothetical protein
MRPITKAPIGTHQEAGAERRQRCQQARGGIVGREERLADLDREECVRQEIVELERIADEHSRDVPDRYARTAGRHNAPSDPV